MNEIYLARFRKVFACSDVILALFALDIAQLVQISDPPLILTPRLFDFEEFYNRPAYSGPKSRLNSIFIKEIFVLKTIIMFLRPRTTTF